MKKEELIQYFRENGTAHIAKMFFDTAEANGIDVSELENIELNLYIKDKSKVKWKQNSNFVKLFTTELERMVRNKMLNMQKLGFITMLTPYLDYQDNSLKNKNGEYLTQEDIMKITGLKRRAVINMLNDLKKHEIIFDRPQENDKRKKKYYLNPNLFYKGKEIDVKIKEYFNRQKEMKKNKSSSNGENVE